MEKQSSFEKEFNRLSFLASIATGDNAEPTVHTTNSQNITKQNTSSVNQNISQNQNSAQTTNLNGHATQPKMTPTVNGLGSTKPVSTPGIDMEKINKILNSNAQVVGQNNKQSIYQNAMKQHSLKTVLGITPHSSNLIIESQSGTSISTPTSITSTKPVITQTILTSQSSFLEQQKQLQSKVSSVMIKPSTAPTQSIAFTTSNQTLNPPLIISSSPQKVQSTVATNAGQTILLPANFAGMAGKVLIVSNPGKPSQAIAINPSGGQTVVSLQNQTATNGKPVLLLPNNSSVGKSHSKPPHQLQQMNTNAVRMIVQNNPGVQPMHTIQPIHQQMPGLTPVSLSTFQNIRPKGTGLSVKTIQPSQSASKVIIAPPKNIQLPTTIHQLTTMPTGYIKPPPATVVSIVSVKPATSSTTSSAALLSNFDKTMSQHLLQLEKTDPHLFKGGKVHINTGSKTNKTAPLLGAQTKQDKNKLLQQQQQTSQMQNLAQTSLVTDKSKYSVTTVHASIPPTKILTSLPPAGSQPTPTGQGTPRSTVTLMPQLLTSLQQQQQQQQALSETAALQDILNKQRQQQLSKQNIKIATQSSTQAQKQQQQQQQMVSQLLAAAATGGHLTTQQKHATQQSLEMYLLQQKIMQAQQQQQQQQSAMPTPTQVQQLAKQMMKPQIQTNLKKVTTQQTPLSLPNNSSSNMSMNQPLKLLSSLTSMVNLMPTATTTASKISIGKSSANKTQPSQSLNIVQPGISTNVGIQPLLFQLSNKQQNAMKTNLGAGFKQHITAAQIQEIQKSYLASQLSAVGSKVPASQVQVGNTSLAVSAKIPIQTVQSIKTTKSAFVPRINTKTASNVTAQQLKINQLMQQGILRPSNANTMPALAKLQSSVTVNKSLQEQLKLLTPAQREQFIKQYSAVAAGKQMQANLANTANPALLASILKNRQALPTAIMSPKGVVQVQQTEHQPVKKGPKGPRGQKRTITEVVPEPKKPEESPAEKRLKLVVADDQRRYLQPNYKQPFSSYKDAFNRLRPYHITHEKDPSTEKTAKFDLLFSGFANNTFEKKRQLLHRFHHLVLRESVLGWPSADDVLMGRLYGSSERERFEEQKKSLADGRAFVIENKNTGCLECVALSIKEKPLVVNPETVETNTNVANLQLSDVDNRLRIASKDIRNSEMLSDDEAEIGKEDEEHQNVDDEDDEATDELVTEEEEDIYDDDVEEEHIAEEIEIEDDDGEEEMYEGQDNELAAATTNLLADMDEDDEDYGLNFN